MKLNWLKKWMGTISASANASPELMLEAQTRLDLTAAEGEDQKLPAFSIRAYSGGELRLPKFRFPVIVDLKGMEITEKSRPALLDHDTKQRVGHTTQIVNAGTHLDIFGIVSATGQAAQEVVASAKNEFPWQASIGVSLKRPLELIEAGKTVTVNGKQFTGPVFIARETLLREISFTALGVDDSTSSRIAAADPQGEEKMGFDAWLVANGFTASALTDQQLDFLRAAFERETGTQTTATPPATQVQASADSQDLLASFRQSLADEAARVRAINDICASADNPTIEVNGQQVDLAAHAIAQNWTAEQVELRSLRAQLSRRTPSAFIHAGGSAQNDIQALEAALVLQFTDQDEEFAARHYTQDVLDRACSREIRAAAGRPLSFLMHEAIRARGAYVPPGTHGDALIAAYRDHVIQAAGPTTLSLPGILGNIANKSAVATFLAVPTTWRQISGTRNVNDFKAHTVYQLTAEGTFTKVGKDGELKSGELKEASWTNKAETYGKRYHFTRQDLINDDLSLLESIRALLGRQAALTLEEAVYTVWMATADSFWHADNKNLVTSTALSPAGLAAVEQKFLDMVDDAGKPIVQTASGILVPTALKYTADRIYQSTMFNETTTANVPQPGTNVMSGRFPAVVSPYLNNAAFTGNSPTTWYMLSSSLKALQVAFLNGVQTPTIESERAEFAVLGFQFRGYFDFGVARWDKRGAVKVTA